MSQINTISKDIYKLKQNYQDKTKLYLNIKDNETYKEELLSKIDNITIKKTELENGLQNTNIAYVENSKKINNIINTINNYINKIQKLEHFTDTNDYYELGNKVDYNNKLRDINKILEELLREVTILKEDKTELNIASIMKQNLLDIKTQYNTYLLNLIKYYRNNKNESNNDDNNYYMNMFANFLDNLDKQIEKLNKILLSKQTNLNEWNLKYEKSKLVTINYRHNSSEIDDLEIKLINLQRELEKINKKIDNKNILLKAEHQLNHIQNIHFDLKNKNTNYFEAFSNYKSAESHNNQFISLLPQNNNKYKVKVNDKCLNVYGVDDYRLDNCNINSQSQLFDTVHIKSESDALLNNKDVKISSYNTNDKYPYHQIKSVISYDCIGVDNDGISVNTCSTNNIKHKWKLSSDEKICLDN